MAEAGRSGYLQPAVPASRAESRASNVASPNLAPTHVRPKLRTTVIIPVYNEEAGLRVVLSDLFSVVDETYEVLVVNDGSSDATAEVAAQFPCRLISHEVNRGKGAAVRSGIEASRGEDVIIIDGDGTYPVEEVPRIVRELREVDLVVASRLRGQDNIPAFNRLGNRLFRGLIRYLYGSQTSDPLSGLYGVKKEHLERMQLGSDDFGIESELAIKAARMRLRTAEFPIEYGERIGQAKLSSLRDGYRILKTIFKMLTLYNPSAAFILPGGSAFGVGIVLLAALMSGPLSVGGVTLGVNSLIVATMLCFAGFQLGVFGFTLNVYCLAQGYTTPDKVTAMFLRSNTARNISTIGLLILASTLVLGAWLANGWAGGGFGEFDETKLLILTSFMAIFGLQLVFSSVFLSIFTAEVRKTAEVPGSFSRGGLRGGR